MTAANATTKRSFVWQDWLSLFLNPSFSFTVKSFIIPTNIYLNRFSGEISKDDNYENRRKRIILSFEFYAYYFYVCVSLCAAISRLICKHSERMLQSKSDKLKADTCVVNPFCTRGGEWDKVLLPVLKVQSRAIIIRWCENYYISVQKPLGGNSSDLTFGWREDATCIERIARLPLSGAK